MQAHMSLQADCQSVRDKSAFTRGPNTVARDTLRRALTGSAPWLCSAQLKTFRPAVDALELTCGHPFFLGHRLEVRKQLDQLFSFIRYDNHFSVP